MEYASGTISELLASTQNETILSSQFYASDNISELLASTQNEISLSSHLQKKYHKF